MDHPGLESVYLLIFSLQNALHIHRAVHFPSVYITGTCGKKMKSKERVPTLFRPARYTEGGNIPFIVVSVHLNIQSDNSKTSQRLFKDCFSPGFPSFRPSPSCSCCTSAYITPFPSQASDAHDERENCSIMTRGESRKKLPPLPPH